MFFTTQAQVASAQATYAKLQSDPRAIGQPITVERDVGDMPLDDRLDERAALLLEYRPNDLRAAFEAPPLRIFVVKDSYFPGRRRR